MKYYPIVVKIDDDHQFFIEDVREWASGNVSSAEGLKSQLIVSFAQFALSWVENWEKENKDDLIAAYDVDTVTGLHLEYRDLREKP